MARKAGPAIHLQKMISEFRNAGIPTVFWNKEDPPNFDYFIETAKLFDHVFTTASEAVSQYERHGAVNKVEVLPFFYQPKLHHPPLRFPRVHGAHFAGTYLENKHADRRVWMDVLLEPAVSYGLDIFARRKNRYPYRWPTNLRDNVRQALPYRQLVVAQALYAVALNVNTVSNSSSMCSRRLFELVASGVPTLSTPSPAIGVFFGDAVHETRSQQEARDTLQSLLSTSRANRVWEPPTHYLEKHSARARVEQLLAATKLTSG